MARSGLEVADVFRRYGAAYREIHGASLCTAQRRVMSAIELCRTAALGGHVERCDRCDHQRVFYNSCRDASVESSQDLVELALSCLLTAPFDHRTAQIGPAAISTCRQVLASVPPSAYLRRTRTLPVRNAIAPEAMRRSS
jgi:hypothetical protein